MKRFLIGPAALVALLASTTGVLADSTAATNANCWGVVVSQRATTYGDIGPHSASQSEPRAGVGNLARDFFELGLTNGPRPGDTAVVLAALDDQVGQDPLGATHCP
jgi:hypothetical protein